MENTNTQNPIQMFNFKDQPVEVIIINGNPYFIGKQVASILGYSNTNDAIIKHVDAEDKLTSQIAMAGQNRNVTLINESGLYSLILSSKLESAKVFKRWVTSEVLPNIRKYGIYATDLTIDKMINNPDFGIKLLQQLKDERSRCLSLQNRVGSLEERVAVQSQQISELRPKAAYYDMILNCKDAISVTVIAKDYGFSSKKLNSKLMKLKR